MQMGCAEYVAVYCKNVLEITHNPFEGGVRKMLGLRCRQSQTPPWTWRESSESASCSCWGVGWLSRDIKIWDCQRCSTRLRSVILASLGLSARALTRDGSICDVSDRSLFLCSLLAECTGPALPSKRFIVIAALLFGLMHYAINPRALLLTVFHCVKSFELRGILARQMSSDVVNIEGIINVRFVFCFFIVVCGQVKPDFLVVCNCLGLWVIGLCYGREDSK